MGLNDFVFECRNRNTNLVRVEYLFVKTKEKEGGNMLASDIGCGGGCRRIT